MAELATIARPYADAFYAVSTGGELQRSVDELDAIAQVASDPQVRQFAESPKADPEQVLELITGVASVPVSDPTRNLLRTIVENHRLAILPEVAEQFRALVNRDLGISHATLFSAFDIDPVQLAEVKEALERRFGRRLQVSVELQPELIGGIRVVVGDEVLDTSVKARLEQMKMALTA